MRYTREELVARWRCCAENNCGDCPGELEDCGDLENETVQMLRSDGVELANKQREIEALLQANEGLRHNIERLTAENERLHKENFWLTEKKT